MVTTGKLSVWHGAWLLTHSLTLTWVRDLALASHLGPALPSSKGLPGPSDGLVLVRLVHLDVVHVGLPVLDVAQVVARQQPKVIVAPGHGTDRIVMGLGQRSQAN